MSGIGNTMVHSISQRYHIMLLVQVLDDWEQSAHCQAKKYPLCYCNCLTGGTTKSLLRFQLWYGGERTQVGC